MTQITSPMVVYWHENQVAISLESPFSLKDGPDKIIQTLNLQGIQNLLNANGLQVQSFQGVDVPHPITPVTGPTQPSRMVATAESSTNAATTDDLNSTIGKYLFRSPRADNKQGTSAMCFFRVARASMSPADDKMAEEMKATSMGSTMKDGAMGSSYEDDDTITTVNLINRNLDALRNAGVPVIAAAPNWLNGGTPPYGCTTHGCPVSPPVPVPVDANCSGNWKLSFTNLLELPPLNGATGNGVTVLVLDTLPKQEQVAGAAMADPNNALLQDVNTNVKITYITLPDVDDTDNPELTATGKDIYGRLVGFPMTDHGTFIAGQIRDLAPGAKVECIRVLNDAGVGTTAILTRALEDIQNRLEGNPPAGETSLSLPLVINLSLVATPPDEIMSTDPTLSQFDKDQVYLLRDTLHTVMSSLAAKGVVFVASSGNDSDPRPDASMTMGGGMPGMAMPPTRFEARFPAAFAYDHTYPGSSGPQTLSRIPGVIPVGALKSPVNGTDKAASYSNYSGSDGINIYGGELLTPIPAPEDDPVPANFVTQAASPIDALRGIYTDTKFPYLSVDDELNPVPPSPHPLREYPEYSNPDPTPPHSMPQRITWAYWSGTSFATPMISALAARALEVDGATVGDAMRSELESVSQVESIWDRLPMGKTNTNGYVVGVTQDCK